MNKLMIYFLFFVVAANIYSTDYDYMGYTCPLCNSEFEYLGLVSFSTAGARQNLDFRMVGNARNPAFVPQCPNCHFVFYNRLFTVDEIVILRHELEINNKKQNLRITNVM